MRDDIGLQIKISQGNSKIGRVPNLSLPPIISCRGDAPCKIECYAQKFYRMYPNVRQAWDSNLTLLTEHPDKFFNDLALYLTFNNPDRFRLHVAGDFLDSEHFMRICDVFESYPNTQVLAFTKRYELPFDDAPPNMKVVLSVWPGLDLPEWTNLPWAWITGDVRFPVKQTHIKCCGSCIECSYSCWSAVSAELPVVFDMH